MEIEIKAPTHERYWRGLLAYLGSPERRYGMIDIAELRKAAKCVYIAVEESIAKDISQKLQASADEIERLQAQLDAAALFDEEREATIERLQAEVEDIRDERDRLRKLAYDYIEAYENNTLLPPRCIVDVWKQELPTKDSECHGDDCPGCLCCWTKHLEPIPEAEAKLMRQYGPGDDEGESEKESTKNSGEVAFTGHPDERMHDFSDDESEPEKDSGKGGTF